MTVFRAASEPKAHKHMFALAWMELLLHFASEIEGLICMPLSQDKRLAILHYIRIPSQ